MTDNIEKKYTPNEKWDKLAARWVDTGPPASPSNDDIENYKNLLLESIGDSQEVKVMILGCTPKLRDMMYDYFRAFDVICVDISQEMYKHTTEKVKNKNHRERFELSDWLVMDLGQNKFHAILGDKIIDNVMPDKWGTLFQRIYYHLESQGSFIVHLAPQNMTLQNITFIDSLKRWGNYYEHNGGKLKEIASAFWEEILGASTFKDGHRYKTQKIARFAKDIEEISKNINSLTSAQEDIFGEFIRVFWQSKDDEWSSYQYEEIVEMMNPYFEFDKIVHSGDYNVARSQPLVRFKARQKGILS